MPALYQTPWAIATFAARALVALASTARAQSIETRAYFNAPIGVNFLIAGCADARAGLSFDPSVPVTNPRVDVSSAIAADAGVLDSPRAAWSLATIARRSSWKSAFHCLAVPLGNGQLMLVSP
jgi:hypothetical protein